ncbi:hypothetical protein DTO013E5_7100 [Penicillium roqueforti]|uniref:uncharacterized protein n=1 Tax=Penicillium roqueforti TaxID=5082 RepID=UPI00190B3ED0|nr:uncharacterized protein LCP9604111_7513 [Penicillium roqueforti]KAF9243594.1 hypothetical protein LCP9604111_7513 [Penicillium roqueforti]KAI1831598.1 hypothetical protein CBS147337_7754 [Penicillium roqueforti]KAI2679449.1 hypothetical protein CBS147355_3931 [Penicillium roqueforti]KAI2701159.1 hypothetical protein CBS147372_5229 [Penicillium roqueforti]KAI2712961.1 hypothetical protein CBS147354_7772 [Penicillium roqueforti]
MLSMEDVKGEEGERSSSQWNRISMLQNSTDYELTLCKSKSTIGVFLLAATNTFLRVIHFKFGSHYGEYVNTESEGTQKILVDNENKDTFIYIHSTKWFDLYEYTTLTLMEFADKHKDILKDVSKILGWLANVSSVGKSDMEQLKAKFDDLKL